MIKIKFIKTKNDNNETEIIAVFINNVLNNDFHNGKLLKCYSIDNIFMPLIDKLIGDGLWIKRNNTFEWI